MFSKLQEVEMGLQLIWGWEWGVEGTVTILCYSCDLVFEDKTIPIRC